MAARVKRTKGKLTTNNLKMRPSKRTKIYLPGLGKRR